LKTIITTLLVYIQIQYYIICYLMTLLLSKDFMPKDDIPISKYNVSKPVKEISKSFL